jgi:sigma-B regulation protein RsbU (phosphoserine phosphatase)
MSTLPPPPATQERPGFFTRVGNFWQRVTEGQQLDDIWRQFLADTRAGYGFYGRDFDWEQVQAVSRWRRPFHIAKQFLWALMAKMSPARRILLLIALVCLLFPHYEGFSFLIFVFLLLLELADKVTMKRDLEIAREIQSWLVPAHPPEVPGADIAFLTRAQNSVAGDYYDVFFLNGAGDVYARPVTTPVAAPPGNAAEIAVGDSAEIRPALKVMLVIADVAGKSIPAALLMATMQASLRTIAGEGAPLAELVARLNRYACTHSQNGERFTTAVLAEYEPQTRRLTYVNAGHNPPILRRGNGMLEKLEAGGIPLGIDADAVYETDTLDLLPGDVLVLYTDGVVEAFNQHREEFGDLRWRNVISGLPWGSAQQNLQYLMAPVDQFVGETRQSDDITYLIFRCT